MVLGLIPARGGSKGIPRKNIKEFCGKPLIQYAIDVGLRCKFIDRVLVSSDDDKILNTVTRYSSNVWVRKRSPSLAQDDTPMMSVIQDACYFDDSVTAVVLLDPTNPLRTVGDVEGAWRLFQTPDTDCVVSGCEAKYHPEFNLAMRVFEYREDGGYIEIWNWTDEYYEPKNRRQECEEQCYQIDVTAWIYSRKAIEKEERIPVKTRLYLVPPERSVSIDTPLDWEIAEFLYRRNN